MPRTNNIERRIFVGLLLILLSAILSGWLVMTSLRKVVDMNDRVIDLHAQALIQAERLRYFAEAQIASGRGFMYTGEGETFLPDLREARAKFDQTFARMYRVPHLAERTRRYLDRINQLEDEHEAIIDRGIAFRRQGLPPGRISHYLSVRARPVRQEWNQTLDELVRFESANLAEARDDANNTEFRMIRTLFVIEVLSFVFAAALMSFILRLTRRGRRLYEAAERAVRARDEVLAVVSHDLKNPLQAIDLNAELLERSAGALATSSRRSVAAIRAASASMRGLIQNILDHAKLEAGHMSLELRDWDIAGILAQARALFEPLAARKGIALAVSASDPGLMAHCDRERVMQILSNLLGNAIKFTPPGGRVQLRASADEAGRRVLVVVRDSGPGIPAEQLPRLFDRFWQAPRTARQGTGLGLAIVKGLVEAHGGTVEALSRPGAGATFVFTLPSRSRAAAGRAIA
jgi:signal transduction histidine kinase